VVAGLRADGPFAFAGLEVGGVITAGDGAPVNSPSEMVYRMSVAGAREVPIERVRNGDPATVSVSLMAAPEDPPRAPITLDRRTVLPGLSVLQINPAVLSEFNLPLSLDGVLIANPGRFGARVGLRPGDVVLGVNGDAVNGTAQLARMLDSPGRYRIDLLRGGKRVVVSFRSG